MFIKKTKFFLILILMTPFLIAEAKNERGQSSLIEKQNKNQVLFCSDLKLRIKQMLDLHYIYKDFDEELSRRTFHKLFSNLDTDKIFFTSLDLYSFKNYKDVIAQNIEVGNCDFLFEIYEQFKIRVKNRVEFAKKVLSKPIGSGPTQYFEISKPIWLQNEQELSERLKKNITFQYLSLKENNMNDIEIKNKILNNYIKIEKRLLNMSTDKLYALFLNCFAQSLDPHSGFMLPSQQESFNIRISNKLEGIGAQLADENGDIVIKSLILGGVAQRDGKLKPGDILKAIDSGGGVGMRNLEDVDIDTVVEYIRGKKGSKLQLEVKRKGVDEKIVVSLVRDEIILENENVKSDVYDFNGTKIGVIKIPSFYTDLACKNKLFVKCRGVAYDTEVELEKLAQKGVEGILIDLRNNGGGDFPQSVKLISLFIPKGVVVQTKNKNSYVQAQKANGNLNYKGPLIVLMNRFSASASEIFAGAIQDYGRGIIVGDDHSYGKATVQVVQEIPGSRGRATDGAIKITQSKFYRPGGTSNQAVGVSADILVESELVSYDIGEQVLEYFLPRDSVESSKKFQVLQNLTPLTQKLKQLSAERLKANKKYQELENKIRKIKASKSTPLALMKENLKIIQDRKNEVAQINKNQELAIDNKIINLYDLQLMEAIAITKDSVILSKGEPRWVGQQ